MLKQAGLTAAALLVSLALKAGAAPAAEKESSPNDYSYGYWLNGWRKHADDPSPDVLSFESSRFAFALNLATLDRPQFALFSDKLGYLECLNASTGRLAGLASAELRVELETAGKKYRMVSCNAGSSKEAGRLKTVRLWESGKWVQHFDVQELIFKDESGSQLACKGTLDLVAWPDSLTLTTELSPSPMLEDNFGPQDGRRCELLSWKDATLRAGFTAAGRSWAGETGVPGAWQTGQTHAVTLNCDFDTSDAALKDVSVAVKTPDGQSFPVVIDKTKNCHVASIQGLKRSWKTGMTDIRSYDDLIITVDNPAQEDRALSLLVDLVGTANITGLCPIVCDEQGVPTGLPVQLSKNWHYPKTGEYLRAYLRIPARPGSRSCVLRIVYGFYGTVPSASHSQLSLVGYGGNGRWDQLAIGCWGETFCLDMDMSLVDIAITDVRCLMVRKGASGAPWGWTDGGWGGDWLCVHDRQDRKLYFTDLKTAYVAHGPCLSDVRYHGHYGPNREVDLQATVHTLRTDDHARTFHRLQYTFQRPLSATNTWLFKMGRTGGLVTPKAAYGNGAGLLAERDVPESLTPKDIFVDTTTLDGNGPWWVAFPGAAHPKGTMPDGSRALVIRSYKATFGGRTYRQPTIRMPVFAAQNVDLLLVPPSEVAEYKPGDSVELDVEWITLPRTADDYYGPNETFRRHLAENPSSWKTVYREARGNDLQLKVEGGVVLSTYPIVIRADKPAVKVEIKGGVGFVPLRFEELETATGWALYRADGGHEVRLDQSVNGNDYWQTEYDAGPRTFRLTFNLPLDGQENSTWILKQEP